MTDTEAGERKMKLSDADFHVLRFLQEKGAHSTVSIGYRFGWDAQDARNVLNRLRRLGIITSKREIFYYCAMNGWRLTPSGRALLEAE